VNASAVIYVKSIGPMRRFYEQLFDLKTAMSADSYCVLESDSVSLSLVKVPDAIAATIDVETPPRRRISTPIKLAFEVPSIERARSIAVALGGQVDPPTTEWSHGGVIHCDGTDPEGNVIQLVSLEVPMPQ
jgi:predicted enzyme related to lactoylglutathione lyase